MNVTEFQLRLVPGLGPSMQLAERDSVSLGLALLALLVATVLALAGNSGLRDLKFPFSASDAPEQLPLDTHSKLPLYFTPNAGQTDQRVRYYARGSGLDLYLTKRSAMLSLTRGNQRAALGLRFLDANPNVRIQPQQRTPAKVNYLSGAQHYVGLPTYRDVVYRDLWPGIDMVFRGARGMLKYEFRLRPRAKPDDIQLAFDGTQGLSLDRVGGLVIRTPAGIVSDAPPLSHQTINGRRTAVTSKFLLTNAGSSRDQFGFAVGRYNSRFPLTIDPGLAYSTYLGGTQSYDDAFDIAVDEQGSAYVTGETRALDFPTTPGALDTTAISNEAFVTKLDPSGSQLVYSTYLGGGGWDRGNGIAVDRQGSAYVTGDTQSTDFPITAGGYSTVLDGGQGFGQDAFVSKLDPSGSRLDYSTYLGGSGAEFASGVALDDQGSAYILGATSSENFPATAGAYDTTLEGSPNFVTKIDSTGSSLAYSTFFAGGDSVPGSIAVNSDGDAYIAGTAGAGFPTTTGAYDTSFNGNFGGDSFVAELNVGGSGLVYSTYLGGSGEEHVADLAVDESGSAYVTGQTKSADFPTTPSAFDTTFNGPAYDGDAFVTKLNVAGSALVYSTYLGGASEDVVKTIAIDRAGAAYVAGYTRSSDFPLTADALDRSPLSVGFLTKVGPNGSRLAYSTFFRAGIRAAAVDAKGSPYLTGAADEGLPTTAGAYDTSLNGFQDAFVTKFRPIHRRRAPTSR
jgi:hypothetical protein